MRSQNDYERHWHSICELKVSFDLVANYPDFPTKFIAAFDSMMTDTGLEGNARRCNITEKVLPYDLRRDIRIHIEVMLSEVEYAMQKVAGNFPISEPLNIWKKYGSEE